MIAWSDADLSTCAARSPITAYAVFTGSALPKFLTNPPLARIWLASHCAPRCARWALVGVSAPAGTMGAATSATLATAAVLTTSARNPRRALKPNRMGVPFGIGRRGLTRNVPFPKQRPLHGCAGGLD